MPEHDNTPKLPSPPTLDRESKYDSHTVLWLVGLAGGLAFYFLLFRLPTADSIAQFCLPLTTSFSSICLTGFLYEILKSKHDRQKFSNDVIVGLTHHIATNGEQIFAFFRSHLPTAFDSFQIHHRIIRESAEKTELRKDIIQHLKDREEHRISALNKDDYIKIYDFGLWWKLYQNIFRYPDDFGEYIARDYTVSWNADQRFFEYSHLDYYKELLKLRQSHSYVSGRIKVLIMCDIHGDDIDVSSRDDMERRALELSAMMAAIVFEKSFCELLKLIATIHNVKISNPRDVFEFASKSSRANIQLMLCTRKMVSDQYKDNNYEDIYHPFNVYGDRAVSRSILRRLARLTDFPPIPHMLVSMRNSEVKKFADIFDEMWNRAGFHAERFFNEADSWDDFGKGSFVRRWTDIGSTRAIEQSR